MVKPFESATRYLQYRIRAKSGFRIHSPFVYHLYSDVVQNGLELQEYRQVEKIRRDLRTFSRYIKRHDLGARAGDFPCDQRFVRVKDIAHRTAVTPRKGQFLFRLVREIHPETILELGTSFGISTMYMALAAPDSRIITIEGCNDSAIVARENFEKAGLKNINLLTGKFENRLEEALINLNQVDLVFFDGNHRCDPTLQYFNACLPHISSRSVLVFDDIHWSKEMEKVWKTICSHPGVKVTIDLFHMGIVYFKEELSKEDYILRF